MGVASIPCFSDSFTNIYIYIYIYIYIVYFVLAWLLVLVIFLMACETIENILFSCGSELACG